MMTSKKKCRVPGCLSKDKQTFHRFPSNFSLGQLWIDAIGDKELTQMPYDVIKSKQMKVCGLHFTEDSYLVQTNRPTLKEDAIPTLRLSLEEADSSKEKVNSAEMEYSESSRRRMSQESSPELILKKEEIFDEDVLDFESINVSGNESPETNDEEKYFKRRWEGDPGPSNSSKKSCVENVYAEEKEPSSRPKRLSAAKSLSKMQSCLEDANEIKKLLYTKERKVQSENLQEVTFRAKGRKHNGKPLHESFEFSIEENTNCKWGKCKLCLLRTPPVVKTIKMTGCNTTGIKRHLQKEHLKEFKETYPLAGTSQQVTLNYNDYNKNFQQEVFENKLVDWLAKKDLPLGFFDDDDSQELFNYLNPTADIPMRRKMTELVINRFTKMQDVVIMILQTNASKVSFTLDGWTSISHQGYYGITGHFIDESWNLHSLVVDFIPSQGEHTGKDIAKCFYETVANFEIIGKVLGITVNNASVNFTFTKELSYLMPFDYKNQHFQCYSHILNIAVQDMLRALGLDNISDSDNIYNIGSDDSEDDKDKENFRTNDDRAREILEEIEVNVITSPLCKLRKLLRLFKNSEQWKSKLQSSCEVCDIKMLSPNIDVSRRWNSTCDMIHLATHMQVPINLLCHNNPALKKLVISEDEWSLLKEMHKYLRNFKILSKAFSGEDYPTLNLIIVGFNMLLDKLENSIAKLKEKSRSEVEEKILSALELGLAKLLKHYNKSNWIYCVVLILDPRYKIETFDMTPWGREMKAESLEKFKNIFKTEYYKGPIQKESPILVEDTEQFMESEDDDIDLLSLYKKNEESPSTSTENTWEREIILYDLEERATATTDVLKWWKDHEKQYPDLARMARDFLAIPASSVPSEQLFSRSSLTIWKHRNRLNDRPIRCLMGLNSWVNCTLTPKIKSSLMDS